MHITRTSLTETRTKCCLFFHFMFHIRRCKQEHPKENQKEKKYTPKHSITPPRLSIYQIIRTQLENNFNKLNSRLNFQTHTSSTVQIYSHLNFQTRTPSTVWLELFQIYAQCPPEICLVTFSLINNQKIESDYISRKH